VSILQILATISQCVPFMVLRSLSSYEFPWDNEMGGVVVRVAADDESSRELVALDTGAVCLTARTNGEQVTWHVVDRDAMPRGAI